MKISARDAREAMPTLVLGGSLGGSLVRRSLLVALGACLAFGATARAAADDFIDSVGRAVHLPAQVRHVVPAGPPADVLLFALVPEKLVGLVEPFRDRAKPFVPPAFADLPGIPRVTREVKPADIEAVKSLHGDLIVDYGDITPAYVATADRISAATGLPYVVLSGYLADTPDIARKLGHILGADARAETIAKAAEAVLARLRPLNDLPDDKRPTVYYARGPEGLRAARPSSTLDQAITAAGGRNVAPAGKGGFVPMTVAAVAALAPTVVVVADPKAAAPGSPLRAALPASTRFYVDPGRPFGWIEAPPSVNRLIGALWLGAKLHPDRAKFDAADARELSEALLGVKLTDEQLRALVR